MIRLQKQDLKKAADFLLKVTLEGKKSVHRMRVVKVLQEQHKVFGDEELELLKSFAELDDNGDLVQAEGGGFKLVGDKKEFKKQQQELMDEDYILEGKNFETALKTVEEVMMDYNKELSESDAEAHFLWVEAFEIAKENQEEKGDDE
ncbi:hypothetical protein [Alkalihalobacillus trypoxylicola]|uniref:Uncharacterized protein n=1 Tax=Alkalihalobacillus trypoxylicola TaxID=519424 RepID=A0A162F6L7_9BACI|nr:hypothetical protein [Alkalihalobacillus trypoxylicola]KYG34904.1 hypothetical protein AZF04_00805 [Alkalihalobacillus trypoxylicola]